MAAAHGILAVFLLDAQNFGVPDGLDGEVRRDWMPPTPGARGACRLSALKRETDEPFACRPLRPDANVAGAAPGTALLGGDPEPRAEGWDDLDKALGEDADDDLGLGRETAA